MKHTLTVAMLMLMFGQTIAQETYDNGLFNTE